MWNALLFVVIVQDSCDKWFILSSMSVTLKYLSNHLKQELRTEEKMTGFEAQLQHFEHFQNMNVGVLKCLVKWTNKLYGQIDQEYSYDNFGGVGIFCNLRSQKQAGSSILSNHFRPMANDRNIWKQNTHEYFYESVSCAHCMQMLHTSRWSSFNCSIWWYMILNLRFISAISSLCKSVSEFMVMPLTINARGDFWAFPLHFLIFMSNWISN